MEPVEDVTPDDILIMLFAIGYAAGAGVLNPITAERVMERLTAMCRNSMKEGDE